MPSKSLPPLQGPLIPTTQIPICVTRVSFPLLLLPDVEPEYACTFIIISDKDNESRLSKITENKNTNKTLLLLFYMHITTNLIIICH
jgi:hypothetical protein